MGLTMRVLIRRSRMLAALGTAVLAASLGIAAVPGTASAAPAGVTAGTIDIYLTNQSSWGLYAESGVTQYSRIALTGGPFGVWDATSYGTQTVDGITGTEYEFAAITTSGQTSSWCMANDDSDGTQAWLDSCNFGSNGLNPAAEWIYAPYSKGGYLLYNVDYLMVDVDYVLATTGLGSGQAAFMEPVSSLGTGVYYRWYLGNV
jgi:hypothetical protein